jgi:hypothetical protein
VGREAWGRLYATWPIGCGGHGCAVLQRHLRTPLICWGVRVETEGRDRGSRVETEAQG